MFNRLKQLKKYFSRKTLISLLGFFSFLIFAYIVMLPFYPIIKYEFFVKKYYEAVLVKEEQELNQFTINLGTSSPENRLPIADFDVSADRLIIKKIGVDSPIVRTENPDYGLSIGAWLDPQTSTPNLGGNTVISGHRFKYLPPSNLTFYLLDKLQNQDIIKVIWKEKEYTYQVFNTKVVEKDDISILENTPNSILTLYTCEPIYSQDKRLVVSAKLITVK